MPRALLSIEFRSLVKEGRGWLGAQTCQRLQAAVLRRQTAPTDRRTLSVVMVGPGRMASLPRGQKRRTATDVLAFALDAPMLGEIVLCPKVIAKRARLWGRTPQAHARFLFVHGLLHLLGYEHKKKKEAEVMERLELRILNAE